MKKLKILLIALLLPAIFLVAGCDNQNLNIVKIDLGQQEDYIEVENETYYDWIEDIVENGVETTNGTDIKSSGEFDLTVYTNTGLNSTKLVITTLSKSYYDETDTTNDDKCYAETIVNITCGKNSINIYGVKDTFYVSKNLNGINSKIATYDKDSKIYEYFYTPYIEQYASWLLYDIEYLYSDLIEYNHDSGIELEDWKYYYNQYLNIYMRGDNTEKYYLKTSDQNKILNIASSYNNYLFTEDAINLLSGIIATNSEQQITKIKVDNLFFAAELCSANIKVPDLEKYEKDTSFPIDVSVDVADDEDFINCTTTNSILENYDTIIGMPEIEDDLLCANAEIEIEFFTESGSLGNHTISAIINLDTNNEEPNNSGIYLQQYENKYSIDRYIKDGWLYQQFGDDDKRKIQLDTTIPDINSYDFGSLIESLKPSTTEKVTADGQQYLLINGENKVYIILENGKLSNVYAKLNNLDFSKIMAMIDPSMAEEYEDMFINITISLEFCNDVISYPDFSEFVEISE